MKRPARLVLALAVFAAVIVGCKSLASGEDAVLVNAEKLEESGFYLTDAFVKLDRANPALETALPGIHAAAQKVRADAPRAIRDLRELIETYRAAPGAKPDLSTAMNLVTQLVADVQGWMTRAAAKGDLTAARVLKDRRAARFAPKSSSFPMSSTAGFIPLAALATAKKKKPAKKAAPAKARTLGKFNFDWLTALLGVIQSGGVNVAADLVVLTDLYKYLKQLFARDQKMTQAQRDTLRAAEEAAFAGTDWDPRP